MNPVSRLIWQRGLAVAVAFLVSASAWLLPATTAQELKPAEAKVKFYCPVAGMPDADKCCCPNGYCPKLAKEQIVAEHKGAKVQFCCAICVKEFKKSPEKFAAVTNHQLVATRQAKQVKCPVTGAATDPTLSFDVAGVSVRFATSDARKKVADATLRDRMQLVFSDTAFARGFVVASK
jgi:hypothetical protein